MLSVNLNLVNVQQVYLGMKTYRWCCWGCKTLNIIRRAFRFSALSVWISQPQRVPIGDSPPVLKS